MPKPMNDISTMVRHNVAVGYPPKCVTVKCLIPPKRVTVKCLIF